MTFAINSDTVFTGIIAAVVLFAIGAMIVIAQMWGEESWPERSPLMQVLIPFSIMVGILVGIVVLVIVLGNLLVCWGLGI